MPLPPRKAISPAAARSIPRVSSAVTGASRPHLLITPPAAPAKDDFQRAAPGRVHRRCGVGFSAPADSLCPPVRLLLPFVAFRTIRLCHCRLCGRLHIVKHSGSSAWCQPICARDHHHFRTTSVFRLRNPLPVVCRAPAALASPPWEPAPRPRAGLSGHPANPDKMIRRCRCSQAAPASAAGMPYRPAAAGPPLPHPPAATPSAPAK